MVGRLRETREGGGVVMEQTELCKASFNQA